MDGSQELYRLLVENTRDLIALLTVRGAVLYASPSFERLLGRPPVAHLQELFGHIHADDAQILRDAWMRTVAGAPQRFEFRSRHADGSWRWFELHGQLVDYAGEPHLLSVLRDVTERKQLEDQLRHAQKLEAIGRLAGGIAHDFNNLLLVIGSYTELVARSLPAGDRKREMLDEVRKAGDRAADLTRQLLAFSRKQVLQPRVALANALITESLKLVERLIGADIELRLALGSAVGMVKVDPGQFEQVLINLAVNARDAMPRGGTLSIETRNAQLRELPCVEVIVRDTGSGMDADTMANIFEPFFTTKETGKGTGLGLAMVYGFVQQSGGHIEVESSVGEGTAFRILLPRVSGPADTAAQAPAQLESPSGTETVLLVEDDDGVRRLLRHVLESHGYTVLEARDGQQAQQIARERPEEIHLLLTDLVMPRIGGHELARKIAALRPQIRTLFMSGYSRTAVAQGVPGAAFLQKPFTPSALAAKLREVLDTPLT